MPDTKTSPETASSLAPPLSPRGEVMDFLLSRRSRPARCIGMPPPPRDELLRLLRAAVRCPDHGKLEPWRFIVLEGAALGRLAGLVEERGAALGHPPEKIAKEARAFADAPLIVAVVTAPKASEKIPAVEQLLSAGAVCLSLLNAALASGWGATWLTGFPAYDRAVLERGLGLAAHEGIAGFVHVGTEIARPQERPRPDPDALTSWVEA